MNCNCILYVCKLAFIIKLITRYISMLKIQHLFKSKKFLCMPKAKVTFIRSCVNRYSWFFFCFTNARFESHMTNVVRNLNEIRGRNRFPVIPKNKCNVCVWVCVCVCEGVGGD